MTQIEWWLVLGNYGKAISSVLHRSTFLLLTTSISPKKLPTCFNGKLLFVICNIFRRYDTGTGVTWCVMWSVGLVTPQTVSNFLNRHASWQLILLLLWHCWQWYAGLTTMKHHLYRVTKTHISCPWQCASFKLKFVILVVEPDRRESQFPGMNIFCQIFGSWDRFKQNGIKEGESPTLWQHLCN